MSEDIVTEKSFLQIKSIRTSSNAFSMKLREDDVIIALDGEMVHKSYEEFSKKLSELKEKKVITLFREGVFFNTFVNGPLGVICENITPDKIPELQDLDINDYFKQDEFYFLYEVFKKPSSVAILLNTLPSILASIAPPLWMLQNRLWTFFCITMVFYLLLFMISPWLFFIGWILKSWYVGNSQIDLLRFFHRLNNYRLSVIFCARNEKEAQEIARKFDEKVDFYYSYLEPVILED
mgnify:CR=1 FL=1